MIALTAVTPTGRAGQGKASGRFLHPLPMLIPSPKELGPCRSTAVVVSLGTASFRRHLLQCPGTLCFKKARKSLFFLLIAPVLSIPNSSLIFTLFASSVLPLLKFLFFSSLNSIGNCRKSL